MTTYTYRNWTAQDIMALHQLNADFGDVNWSLDFCQTALISKHFVRLACYKHKIVAFIMVNLFSETAEIYDLVVDGAHREHGIAHALLDLSTAAACSKSCTELQLECRKSNLPAKNLYMKYGFFITNEVAKLYRSPSEDAIVLRKEL